MGGRTHLCMIVIAALLASMVAVAGPPLDGPPRAQQSIEPPPPLLSTTSESGDRPATWKERHEWEERATFVGIAGGAALGGLGSFALMSIAATANDSSALTRVENVVALSMLAFMGAGAGAYAGGFAGAGIGVVLDAANAPGP